MADAPVVHDLPDDLAHAIGMTIVAYARLEHMLTQIPTLLLQLNKAEARIALREPRAADRLEMALDLFAIKGIEPNMDCVALRTLIEKAGTARDQLAHGVWLRDETSGTLYLRIARSNWPKSMTRGDTIKRAIFPQAIPYGVAQALEALALAEAALDGVNQLGATLDDALLTLPERFRPPAPLINPLGHRAPKRPQAPREPSRPKLQPE